MELNIKAYRGRCRSRWVNILEGAATCVSLFPEKPLQGAAEHFRARVEQRTRLEGGSPAQALAAIVRERRIGQLGTFLSLLTLLVLTLIFATHNCAWGVGVSLGAYLLLLFGPSVALRRMCLAYDNPSQDSTDD